MLINKTKILVPLVIILILSIIVRGLILNADKKVEILTNGSLKMTIDNDGDVDIVGMLTAESFIVRNLSSIIFGNDIYNYTAKIDAEYIDFDNKRRNAVALDTDFGIINHYNGSLFITNWNKENTNISNSNIVIINDLGENSGIIKMSSSHWKYPDQTFFYSRGHRETFLGQNKGEIAISMYDSASGYSDFSFKDFVNLTDVIIINNKSNNYKTQFNYNVSMEELKGTGNAYVCVNPEGELFRNKHPCQSA